MADHRTVDLAKMPKIYRILDGADPTRVLSGMQRHEAQAVLDSWPLWALPHQLMPPGRWRRWMLLGGRGIGKTKTTSKTVHEVARDKESLGDGIIAIVGRTFTDVRQVNVQDTATGILGTAPEGFRPKWRPGPGELTWPNGVVGRVFSADSPESLRGTNIGFLVADEIAVWPDGERTWWEILELCVRVGRAQIAIATTPRPLNWLRQLADDPDTVVTRATTYDNPFLSADVRARYERAYKGTRAEQQELLGAFVEDVAGAVVRRYEDIADNRVSHTRQLERVVIGVDPAVTAHKRSDDTGIVVFGVDSAGHGYVIEDATGKYSISQNEWAERVCHLYRKHRADAVVVETNRGGDMVIAGMRAADPSIRVVPTSATRGKMTRAEPVGALYEQGRIHHVGLGPRALDGLRPLETELTTWVPNSGQQSPNRIDALVWAVTHTLLDSEQRMPWDTPLAYAGF